LLPPCSSPSLLAVRFEDFPLTVRSSLASPEGASRFAVLSGFCLRPRPQGVDPRSSPLQAPASQPLPARSSLGLVFSLLFLVRRAVSHSPARSEESLGSGVNRAPFGARLLPPSRRRELPIAPGCIVPGGQGHRARTASAGWPHCPLRRCAAPASRPSPQPLASHEVGHRGGRARRGLHPEHLKTGFRHP
jgi:hypothetical protein